MNIKDYDEVKTRFNRQKFKSIVETIEKNIKNVKIELYKTKNLSLKSEELSNFITNDFNEAKIIIIKKNEDIIFTCHTLGLADIYAMINIYKNKLSDRDYKITLKTLKINNIKTPMSHNTFFKWNLILCNYAIISNGSFFLYLYFFTDIFSKRSWHIDITEIVIVIITLILIHLTIITFYFFILYKSKKEAEIKISEIKDIEIKK